MQKVLVLPYASNNPYQKLLYENKVTEQYIEPLYYEPPEGILGLFSFFSMSTMLISARLRGARIAHLHWLYFLELPDYGPLLRFLSFLQTMTALWLIHALGYKLVWTAHNVLPHESNVLSARTTRYTVRLADKIIVHSPQALKQFEAIGIHDTSKMVTIPHGNYDGVYPTTSTRNTSRKKFGIKSHEKVILFFGVIRPYKGVEELIDAYRHMPEGTGRLMIVGKCSDKTLHARIMAAQKERPDIFYVNQSVPVDAVATYFQAADVVCLPFQSITTSGSALLAATFGKPLVAPYQGSLRDFPKTVGALYDPSKKNALQSALQSIVTDDSKIAHSATRIRAYADTLAWDKIATKTCDVYKDLA